jgi:SAM-dependent methyltransferase
MALAPEAYSFTRYLSAKKSVDDRALNRQVWRSLAQALPPDGQQAPLRVLEIGAGTGVMFERMLDWGLLRYADYTALDVREENILSARQTLPRWAALRGSACHADPDASLVFSSQGLQVRMRLEAIDLHEFIRRQGGEGWDLLVAHAVLDLLDLPDVLPPLLSLCRPGGLFYFTINFDGLTLFEPAIDPPFDELVQALYHQTMDRRVVDSRPSGDSRSGRHLFGYLLAAGAQVIDAGASDWVVFPVSGSYPYDEAYFLHYIVHTIHQALAGHPQLEASQEALPDTPPDTPQNAPRFERWISERHAQIERGELVYIAHQLDFLGRAPGAPPVTAPAPT